MEIFDINKLPSSLLLNDKRPPPPASEGAMLMTNMQSTDCLYIHSSQLYAVKGHIDLY